MTTIRWASRWVLAGGVRLHLRDWQGGAPACLLIHGFGEGAFVWDAFVRSLAGSHRALAVDLRGHGDSGWSAEREYTLDRHLTDVTEACDALGIRSAVVIGHSLGGNIAIRLAALRPEIARALVIVDAGPNLRTAARAQIRSQVRSQGRTFQTIAEYADWLGQRRPLVSGELLAQIAAQALKPNADGGFMPKVDRAINETPAGLDDGVLEAALAAVACPTLLLRGRGSALLTQAAAEQAIALARHGSLQIVDRAGHAVMLDNPGEFYERVRGFLERTVARQDPAIATTRGRPE